MIKKIKLRESFLIVAIAIGPLLGADQHGHKGHGNDPILLSGTYSAHVKALACDACAPLIEKTLRKMDEIGPIHVDTKDSRVHFSVKDGKSIRWSAIQSALKNSAEQMDRGADFALSDFQTSPPRKLSKMIDKVLSSGYYDAKVEAIVCGGCKKLIEETMRSVEGVGAAQVNEKNGTVRFAVMTGKTVQLSKLQLALRTAADKMGMGADFSLIDLRPVKKG